MSKILEKVKADLLGIGSGPVDLFPGLVVKREIEPYDPTYSYEYRVGVNLGYQVYVSRQDKDGFEKAQKAVLDLLRNDIYGEFYRVVLDLRLAIFNRDSREALKLIDQISRIVTDRG